MTTREMTQGRGEGGEGEEKGSSEAAVEDEMRDSSGKSRKSVDGDDEGCGRRRKSSKSSDLSCALRWWPRRSCALRWWLCALIAADGDKGCGQRLWSRRSCAASVQSSKDPAGSGSETPRANENGRRDDTQTALTRIAVPLVTRSTLEVVIPDFAAPKLLAKSKSKLSQISKLSGAKVTLVEDDPDETKKIIRISGTPEQSERAQNLLQGFILSTQEDGA